MARGIPGAQVSPLRFHPSGGAELFKSSIPLRLMGSVVHPSCSDTGNAQQLLLYYSKLNAFENLVLERALPSCLDADTGFGCLRLKPCCSWRLHGWGFNIPSCLHPQGWPWLSFGAVRRSAGLVAV